LLIHAADGKRVFCVYDAVGPTGLRRADARVDEEQGYDPHVCGSRPITAVNSRAGQVPGLSLRGGHLLVEGVWVGLLVLDAVEVLSVDVRERGAVAGVAEEQVEHRPDE
jgi:hypothetical protein